MDQRALTGTQSFLKINEGMEIRTRPWFGGSCKEPPQMGLAWSGRWVVSAHRSHLSCGTRTTRLNSLAVVAERPPPAAPTTPKGPRMAPAPSPKKVTPEMELKTHSQSWAGGTCSAPSCASARSWGACRTYRSPELCSCRACRWCARGSASSGHYYWRNVGRTRRTHTWRVSHLLTAKEIELNLVNTHDKCNVFLFVCFFP